MRVLFVCTGNTCRSSMAEAIFKHLAEKHDLSDRIEVMSAGTAALEESPATDQAIAVMKEKGLDLSEHRSTPVTKELIQQADLILTMTERHKAQVLSIEPSAQGKVYTLREYALKADIEGRQDQALDISDPYGQPVDVYRQCAMEIEEHLVRALERIKERLQEENDS